MDRGQSGVEAGSKRDRMIKATPPTRSIYNFPIRRADLGGRVDHAGHCQPRRFTLRAGHVGKSLGVEYQNDYRGTETRRSMHV